MLVILVTVTLLFPVKDGPVYAQLAAWACTAALGAWIMNRAFRQRMQPGDRVQDVTVREILSISLPMLMTSSLHVVIAQTGVIMLAVFSSEAEVGYYDMTAKLAALTSYVLTSVNSMAGPRFSELFHSGRIDELFFVAKKVGQVDLLTTAPLLLGLVLLGKPILRTLFGQEFVAAYPALVFLALGQFVNRLPAPRDVHEHDGQADDVSHDHARRGAAERVAERRGIPLRRHRRRLQR
jgi:O-antigen/teichoic acid export membrane protein